MTTSGSDPIRPVGGFFGLAVLDIPRQPNSIWQYWTGFGAPAATAWTARAALARLIQSREPQHVWLPAYLCGELASAAPRPALRFYPLDDELSPDIEYLRRHLQSGDMAVAVDYFGWPPSQDFTDFAAQTPDVIWIEDRAHCLWSSFPPWAQWLLYSPRKLVGVPDGGILISRSGKELLGMRECGGDTNRTLPELMRFEDVRETGNAAWHSAFRTRESHYSAEPLPISRLTLELLQRIPFQPLAEARQQNYRFLAERLGAYRAWHRSAEGVAPFGLAILVEDAAELSAALARERLFCARHWPPSALIPDQSEFPGAYRLARSLLTLPCDHRYDEGMLGRLADAVCRLASVP